MPEFKEFKGFISYAHANEKYFKKIHEILGIAIDAYAGNKKITLWSDKSILAGDNWHDTIQDNLTECDFVILLVSNAFFKSPYIKIEEFPKIIDGFRKKNKVVIPIEITKTKHFDTFAGLGNIQFFTKSSACLPFETFGGKFDKEPDGQDWLDTYANDLYDDLVAQLSKLKFADDNDQEEHEKIRLVSDFLQVKAVLKEKRTRTFHTAFSTDYLVDTAVNMQLTKPKIRHLVVVDNSNNLEGIISRRDIVKVQVSFESKSDIVSTLSQEFMDKMVGDVMVKHIPSKGLKVVCCEPSWKAIDLIPKFVTKETGHTISSLPVIKDNKVIEIITYTDILVNWKAILEPNQVIELENLTVERIMTKTKIEALPENARLSAAVFRMMSGRRAIPIISTENNAMILKGMLSDFRAFEELNNGKSGEIKHYMRKKDFDLTNYLSLDMTFTQLVDLFIEEKDLTSLPVLNGEILIGLVSYTDLLKQMIKLTNPELYKTLIIK